MKALNVNGDKHCTHRSKSVLGQILHHWTRGSSSELCFFLDNGTFLKTICCSQAVHHPLQHAKHKTIYIMDLNKQMLNINEMHFQETAINKLKKFISYNVF